MSSSMIQELIQLLQCRRRAPKLTAATQKERNVKSQEETSKWSKDITDLSTDAFSDNSLQTDSCSEATDGQQTPARPPPGLEAPADQPHEKASNRSFKYWEGVVSRHPQQQAQQTTGRAEIPKMGRGARWPKAPNQQPFDPPWRQQKEDPLVELKEAISKLGPSDIAAVKSLLDSKLCDDTTGHNPPPWTASKVRLGGRAQRPFTPFGGKVPFAQPSDKNRPQRSSTTTGPMTTPNDMNDEGPSLRSFLYELAQMGDNSRVLSVRRINRLGYDSAPILQDYFAKFGTVQRVLVAPTTIKSGGQKKSRPAGLGFIVMSKSEEVQAALKHGEAHTLQGVEIMVQSFQSHGVDGH